jgi:hypothetical protein
MTPQDTPLTNFYFCRDITDLDYLEMTEHARSLERSLAAAQARVEKMGSAIEEYRAMWMICHENDPRPANSGDLTRIGQLRGRLFASTEE